MASLVAQARRKRERSIPDCGDEEYMKSKRLLQEGFRTMTIGDQMRDSFLNSFHSSQSENTDDQSVSDAVDGNIAPNLLERHNSVETSISEEDSDDDRDRVRIYGDNDIFISAIKGGRQQYVRKVDFLVDELIRKNQRTSMNLNSQQEITIPGTLGPHPGTDNALSVFVPPIHFNFRSIAEKESSIEPTPATHDRSLESQTRASGTANPHFYSGNVTHGDWEIEEISSEDARSQAPAGTKDVGNNRHSPDIDISDESDMACCDDWSKHPSLCESHNSSISTMESEDEVSHTMEMCTDDKYFNSFSSSNVFNFDSNMSMRAIVSKPIQKEKEASVEADDVIQVGIF